MEKQSDVTWKDVATVMSNVYCTHFPPSTIHTSFDRVVKGANRHRDLHNRNHYGQQIFTRPKVAGKRKMFSMTDLADADPEPKHPRITPFQQVSS